MTRDRCGRCWRELEWRETEERLRAGDLALRVLAILAALWLAREVLV